MFIKEEKKFKKLGYVEARNEMLADNEKAPALLFVHGAGARGDDLEVLMNTSAIMNAEKFDFKIRIFEPQCYAKCWFEIFEQLEEFAEYVASLENVDESRLYLAGVSMGGYAAWQLGMSRNKLFAAMTPICGGGMYWMAEQIRKIPIWAFHGALDRTVYVSESINMVNAVNACGGNAKLTIYPDLAHSVGVQTFSNPEYWQWLLTKSLQ